MMVAKTPEKGIPYEEITVNTHSVFVNWIIGL
jgi:hypothetical protein